MKNSRIPAIVLAPQKPLHSGQSSNSPWTGTERRAGPLFFGPGLITTDFSIRKVTSVSEKVRSEFRAEFFNIANHANFSTPNRNFGDGNFGRVTDTADPRIIQLGLKLLF